ncbi:hypothetical protein ACJJTC_002260 [Scirpophaga incertulas]
MLISLLIHCTITPALSSHDQPVPRNLVLPPLVLKLTVSRTEACGINKVMVLWKYVRYFGHVARRDTSNLERLVVTGKIEGKRPRGRSPKRWSDQIVEELQIPASDALHQATERDQWRRLVDGIKRSHDPQL